MNGLVNELYFQNKRNQDILLHVLFVWSHLHKNTGYRQGMHEIVAPILYVLQNEIEI